MGRRYDSISFLSDLGLVDEHVGVVKAIVRDLAPHVHVIDLTHQIGVSDVRAGSLALARCMGYVPSGVVLAVVGAGVGAGDGLRPAVAIEVAGGEGVVLGPDNGVLASAVAMAGGAGRTVLLDKPEYHLASPGAVLPSRDVFATVAAHLCNGVDLAEVGTLVDADTLLPGVVPLPRDGDDGGVHAEVLWVDRVGNCQLNVGPDDLAPWGSAEGARVQVATTDITRVAERVARAGTLGAGAVGLLVDPYGMLSVVLDHRSAAEELSVAAGDLVRLTPLAEGDRGPGTAVPVAMRPPR